MWGCGQLWPAGGGLDELATGTIANCRSHMPSRPLGKRKRRLPTTMAAQRSDAGTASSDTHRFRLSRPSNPGAAPLLHAPLCFPWAHSASVFKHGELSSIQGAKTTSRMQTLARAQTTARLRVNDCVATPRATTARDLPPQPPPPLPLPLPLPPPPEHAPRTARPSYHRRVLVHTHLLSRARVGL